MKPKHKDSLIASFICLAFMFVFAAIVIEYRGGKVDYLPTFGAVSGSVLIAVLSTRIKEGRK